MDEKIIERCRRFCGSAAEECFVDKPKQLECIADLVSNKAYAISLLLETARQEGWPGKMPEYIEKALRVTNELGNWVKFLLLTRDLRELSSLVQSTMDSERRDEMRYPLPDAYRKYIGMRINLSGSPVPVRLLNFGQNGVQFMCPEPIDEGTAAECILATIHPVEKELHLRVRSVYCKGDEWGFVIGARIEDISDPMAFNFFSNVFDFIRELG